MSEPEYPKKVIVAASITSTATASLITNPFEVVKTKQIMNSLRQPVTVFVRNFITTQGYSALWRGAHFTIFVSAMGNSVYFLMYEKLKRTMDTYVGRFGFGLSAFVSRITAVSMMLPIEILKLRAYVKEPLREGQRSILAFHGLQSQVWRDVIWSTIFWQLYEEGVKLRPVLDLSENTAHILSSVCGGIVANIVTHPLDVLKTRLQLNFKLSEFPPVGLSELWHKEGPAALYTGLQIRCARTVVSLPVFILSYIHTKVYYNRLLAA